MADEDGCVLARHVVEAYDEAARDLSDSVAEMRGCQKDDDCVFIAEIYLDLIDRLRERAERLRGYEGQEVLVYLRGML